MAEKTFTQVTLLGKTYHLGGYEDEAYLQRVATYVNSKLSTLRGTSGFLRQTPEMQQAMLALNLADDYFKSQEKVEELKLRQDQLERTIYELKHELVSLRMTGQESSENASSLTKISVD